MRSEKEMLDLIISTAAQDERIRAVIMNGSRANPNAQRDFFQDFDIVYVVADLEPFRHNLDWIRRFGEIMILQLPDEMQEPPPVESAGFAYLMQFMDGNRIDLSVYPLAQLDALDRDSQSSLLLDKSGIVPPFAPASDADYLPKPPTAKHYFDCCNEFWWLAPYVAKGLWREEILYAEAMLDEHMRGQLMRMLTWHIGVQTQFAVSPGKLGKHFKRYLAPELWQLLEQTYADADYDRTWDALFAICGLFRQAAGPVAEHFGFEYPHGDDQRVSAHLEHVRFLPRDAQEMY